MGLFIDFYFYLFTAGNNMIPFLNSKGTSKQSIMDHSLRLSTKSSDADLCTAIDVQNEALITEAIQNRFPRHLVIGEESTGTEVPPLLTDHPTWVIDPIDGT
jgi:myo-inositol-1(or 4)-monophosphatase